MLCQHVHCNEGQRRREATRYLSNGIFSHALSLDKLAQEYLERGDYAELCDECFDVATGQPERSSYGGPQGRVITRHPGDVRS